MVNNGTFHYDHDRDGTHSALDGCEAAFRHAKHETFIAIRYDRDRLMVSQWTVELELKGGYYQGSAKYRPHWAVDTFYAAHDGCQNLYGLWLAFYVAYANI